MLRFCVICRCVIWHTEGRFCLEHKKFAELWSNVQVGVKSDWYPRGEGLQGCVSHKAMQLTPRADKQPSPTPWRTVIGDVLRTHGHWLDHWGEQGGVAA